MRIVQFQHDTETGVPTYPFEGIESFGTTVVINGVVVGEYFGSASVEDLPDYQGDWPISDSENRTYALKPGMVLQLLGASGYTKIFTAAYPTDGSPPDKNALFFLESAKNPHSDDGLLVVNKPPVTDAMALFLHMGFITQEDHDRVINGIN